MTDTPHVYTAMNEVQKGLAAIGVAKEDKNKMWAGFYRGIDAVMNAVGPLLGEAGLLIIPNCLKYTQVDRETTGGKLQIHTIIEIEYTFVSLTDASTHVATAVGEAMDSSDKSLNQADTAAYKNMLFKTFCIPVEGQIDPDSKAPEAGVKAQEPTQLATADDVQAIRKLMSFTNTNEAQFIKFLKVDTLEQLPLSRVVAATDALQDKKNGMETSTSKAVDLVREMEERNQEG